MALEAICFNTNCNVLNPVNRDGCFKRSLSFQSGGNNQDGMRRDLDSELVRPVRSLSTPTEIIESLFKTSSKVITIQPSAKRVQYARSFKQAEDEKPKARAEKKKKKKKENRDNRISRANSENIRSSNLVLCPPYGTMSVVGKRHEMEDAVATVPSFYNGSSSSLSSDLHFFGVYDGHGGSQASAFCKERLHQVLAEELGALPPYDGRRDPSEWEKAMRNCFSEMDVQVVGMCPTGNCRHEDNTVCTCCKDPVAPDNVGSTAVVAVVSRSQVVVANCGDSRAVLCRGGKAIALSNDQKPEREDEMNRIEAAGGQIVNWNGYRVGGFLAMSRAIGDRFLKQYVISEPEVTCTQRTEEDEFLILASDELWDVLSNECASEVAGRCLSGYRPRRFKGMDENSAVDVAASVLTKLADVHGSADNISVVVIDLNNNRRRRRNNCSRYLH